MIRPGIKIICRKCNAEMRRYEVFFGRFEKRYSYCCKCGEKRDIKVKDMNTSMSELKNDYNSLVLEKQGLEEEIKYSFELIEKNKKRLLEIESEFEWLKDASHALKNGDSYGLKIAGY